MGVDAKVKVVSLWGLGTLVAPRFCAGRRSSGSLEGTVSIKQQEQCVQSVKSEGRRDP